MKGEAGYSLFFKLSEIKLQFHRKVRYYNIFVVYERPGLPSRNHMYETTIRWPQSILHAPPPVKYIEVTPKAGVS